MWILQGAAGPWTYLRGSVNTGVFPVEPRSQVQTNSTGLAVWGKVTGWGVKYPVIILLQGKASLHGRAASLGLCSHLQWGTFMWNMQVRGSSIYFWMGLVVRGTRLAFPRCGKYYMGFCVSSECSLNAEGITVLSWIHLVCCDGICIFIALLLKNPKQHLSPSILCGQEKGKA